MKKYLSLIKFSHTIFAMPFALIGFFIATKEFGFEWLTLVKVVLCMIFARSSAMAFNRFIDRKFDADNRRTSNREIPNGEISPRNALIFIIINIILLIITTYFINNLCFLLSPIAIIIILGYSYTKRFTSLCHLILGLGISLSPIGAYIAVSNIFDLLPILFSITVLLWVSGFDIIYSLQDDHFDKSRKLHSIPALLGRRKAIIISKTLHILCLIVLTNIGIFYNFSILYWIGLTIFTLLIIYQQLIVNPSNLDNINIVFFITNGFASIIFGVFVILDIIYLG